MRSGRRTGWNFIRGEEPRDSRSRLCPAVQWGFRASSSGTDGLFLLFFKKRNFWISYYIFTLVNGKREKKRLNAWSESKNKQFSLFYLIILVLKPMDDYFFFATFFGGAQLLISEFWNVSWMFHYYHSPLPFENKWHVIFNRKKWNFSGRKFKLLEKEKTLKAFIFN